MDRSVVFLDGAHIEYLLKEHFNGQRINYEGFVSKIAAGSSVVRTYYYHCPPYQSDQPTEEEREMLSGKKNFFDALSKFSRFQLRLGKLEKRDEKAGGSPVFVQKRVDIMLAIDMVRLAMTRQIQRAILVTGDSDLLPAVEATKQLGVVVSLWHGPRGGQANTVHRDLWDACDDREEIKQSLIDSVRLQTDIHADRRTSAPIA